MRRTSVAAAVSGFLAGLIFVGLFFSPRVTDVSPGPISSTAWPHISVSFNRPLDLDSLGRGVILEPMILGQSQIAGDQVIFEPSEPLQYGRRYTATLSTQVRVTGGLPYLGKASWSFAIDRPQLVYLRRIGDQANLWIHESANSTRQLTHESGIVWDYQVAPDGRGWVVSNLPGDGGSELLQINNQERRRLLVRCPVAHCRDGRFQPGGNLLAYERQPSQSGPLATEIWLLDLTTMVTFPASEIGALSEPALAGPTGRFPRWSYDGRYLAFYRPELDLIIFVDTMRDSPAAVPAVDANLGEWSPAEHLLAYTELTISERQPHEHEGEDGEVSSRSGPSLYHHLVLASPEEEQASELSTGLELDEGLPSWSPDGSQLAVTRGYAGAGRQIWLLAADGSGGRQITDDPFFHHTSLSWSPDGQEIAFMRRPAGDNTAGTEIWTVALETGEMKMVIAGAYFPGWRP